MAKFTVVGLPQQQPNVNSKDAAVKKILQPVDRSKANLEAEKGETVFTKMSDTDNYPEFYEIGGKPHSEGGTPLNLPTGDPESGKGASFIFSKKLTEKDPSTLEFFGMNSKRKVSYADISKKWLDVINSSKEVLKNENSDKISINSAKKNMDSAVVKLSALALKQEASKGMPNGASAMFQPFLEKIGANMESILMPQQNPSPTEEEPTMALGGSAFDKYPFPKFDKAGPVTKAAFNKQSDDEIKKYFNDNVEIANHYAYLTNLVNNDAFVDQLVAQANKLAQDPSVSSEAVRKNYKELTKDEVKKHFLNSNLRALSLQAHGIDNIPTNAQGKQHEAINQKLKDLKLDDLLIDPANVWKEQAGRSGMLSLIETKDAYKDKFGDVLNPSFYINKGKADEKYRDIHNIAISKIDGVIGDTYAKETFGYKPAVVNDKDNPKDGESTVDKGAVKKLADDKSIQAPYGFRQEDINALNRAVGARVNVKKYMPWSVTPTMEAPEGVYIDPKANINAINAQANQALQSQQAYGDAQSATANAIAINASAMGQANQAMNQMADQNVNISNSINSARAQILNQRNGLEAQNAQQNYDKTVVANQQYDNAINTAKDRITALMNQTLTNASNIYNLNQTQDNFYKDALTGKVSMLKGRELKNVGDDIKYADLYKKNMDIPGMTPEIAHKAAVGELTGKWVIEKNEDPK